MTDTEVCELEAQMEVSSMVINSRFDITSELSQKELYPQLIEIVEGLMNMWRSMNESHRSQKLIFERLDYLNTIPSNDRISEIHIQSILKLELEVQQWHKSFLNILKAQRNYFQSLTDWLRLSLFQYSGTPLSKTIEESKIHSLCKEWYLALDRIPEKAKAASEGIKRLLTLIYEIEVQEVEELKIRKRSDYVSREFEKNVVQVESLERRSPTPIRRTKDKLIKKQAMVESSRGKAEEVNTKYENSAIFTRKMILHNLQTGCQDAFQGIVEFSTVCAEIFESIYNNALVP